MTSSSRRNPQPRGFSLIEVMVALGIGTLVLLIGVFALGTVRDGYERGASGIGTEREARAVLTQVAEDLSKAVMHEEDWLHHDKGSGTWRTDRLGFLCLQPDDAQSDENRIGDLCAVNYYLRDLEIGGVTVRCLMRGFHDSGETFAAVRGGSVSPLWSRQDRDEPVAFGVVSFEAEPLRRDPSGALREWQVTEDPFEGIAPDLVRLRLVVARRQLVAKLDRPGDWDSSPLLGSPDDLDSAAELEVFEVMAPFSHAN